MDVTIRPRTDVDIDALVEIASEVRRGSGLGQRG